MELSREAILSETNYGINIYAFVLKQYYPGKTVLSLSGRDCKLACNPFNDNKPTLHVSIKDNCAQHYDTEIRECKGDVFDFAAKHFALTSNELYEKLNNVMHLRIGAKGSYLNAAPVEKQPPVIKHQQFNAPVFSYFKAPVTNIVPLKSVSLLEVYELIKSNRFASQTKALRSMQDKKAAKEYKALNFDYVTFSGIFSKRADMALQKHSGLLTIDFDHIGNIDEWKTRLLADEYFETELLFDSPSGDGLKWIIPIDLTKAKHSDYFKSVSYYLLLTYGLPADPNGGDLSRACFLPHDPNIHIHSKYLH